MLEGGKQANINDTNIQPFKSCNAIGTCQPALMGMWEKNTDVKVRNKPALLDISTIQCQHGGTISIDDAGQKEVGTAVTKDKEVGEAIRDADCQYKLLINICSDINNDFMQTQLKKEAQKFSKWNKYKSSTMDTKNKEKTQIAEKETSSEKEKYLKEKILDTFKETYKNVKQKSGPELDTKGIIKTHGLSLCDYEQKNFYSAKMLPVIVYGYLMQAGNLTITENEKNQIEAELNSDIKTSNTEQIELKDYKIQNNVKQTKEVPDHKINSSDVTGWIEIGKMLYTSTKYPPTEADVLNAIRKNGKSVAGCPFSVDEWNKTHSSSKELNNDSEVNNVKQKSDIKEKRNKDSQNDITKKTEVQKVSTNKSMKLPNNTNTSTSKQPQNSKSEKNEKRNCTTCPHENQKLNCRDTWDVETNNRIKKLDPRIRCIVKHLINLMEDKYKIRMRVTDGYRTHAEQNNLYKKGRTTKGPKVTWVKGGYSYHNYGLAVDVCRIEKGKDYWYMKDYKIFNSEAIKFGAEWGISFKDNPHFQFPFGKTAAQYYQDYKNRGNKLSYEFEK